MKTLVTIIIGTNRPQNIADFVTDLEKKSSNPQQIEVIFSVDKGDDACINILRNLQSTSKLKIKYLEGIRYRGYYEANLHYNECLHLADKEAEFFAVFSDKLKIETYGWDEKLKNYSNYFCDGLFRVRISKFKNLRYCNSLWDALTKPDNFAFHSRKFVELSGGWGDAWGPDTWAQGIIFFSELIRINDREIVANDINLEEYHYSDNLSNTRSALIRNAMIGWSFQFLSTSKIALYNFYRIAIRMKLYIDNYELLKTIPNYKFIYTPAGVEVVDELGVIINAEDYNSPKFHEARLFIAMNNSNLRQSAGELLSQRVAKLSRVQNKMKRGVLQINIFITRIKLFYLTFKGILNSRTLILSSSEYKFLNEKKIQSISKSEKFIIEQNSEIEHLIRKKYYETLSRIK